MKTRSQREINKYVTQKVFGECWHPVENALNKPLGVKAQVCKQCETTWMTRKHNNFFTLEGCMKLWLKIQGEEWFDDFYVDLKDNFWEFDRHEETGFITFAQEIVHPDRLAPAVVEFLKGME